MTRPLFTEHDLTVLKLAAEMCDATPRDSNGRLAERFDVPRLVAARLRNISKRLQRIGATNSGRRP